MVIFNSVISMLLGYLESSRHMAAVMIWYPYLSLFLVYSPHSIFNYYYYTHTILNIILLLIPKGIFCIPILMLYTTVWTVSVTS